MDTSPNASLAFLAMAHHAEVAARLSDAIIDGRWSGTHDLSFICIASGLPLSQQGMIEKVLKAGSTAGYCRRVTPLMWEPLLPVEQVRRLADMLRGAAIYRKEIHRDRDEVEVILTRPPKPSQLERALLESGYSYFGLEGTGETFEDMADKAQNRFVVMTPFLDKQGALTVLSLFKRVKPGVRREIILRYKDAKTPPDGFSDIQAELKSTGVAVYNYRIPRNNDEGYETFHAKVVLVDDNWSYAGSANMTQWSLDYSMELGFTARGQSAARVGNIIDAIVKISQRVC